MPYINRVLGPESLGKVEYANSIINYFILLSAIGIPVYGIRPIAKIREDSDLLSKTTVELLCILLVTTLSAYILLFFITILGSQFHNYTDLIILMSSMLLLNNLGAEWFFQGIEDQLYITVRYVVVRIITLVLLFILVKAPSDYMMYALIVVLNTVGSNFLNFIKIKNYIKRKHLNFSVLNLKQHIRPTFTIFLASISVSIYLQIDTFLLGYMAGDQYVGYYSVANKLLRYVILFITTIGSVLLPRLSNFWVNDKNMYFSYLQKSFFYFLIISLPASVYFYFFSEEIILLMAGEMFKNSIITLKILSPICFLVAMAYFFGFLILYPQHKERIYSFSVLISAIVCLGLNLLLMNKYQQNGSASAQLVAEFLGVFFMVFFIVKKKMMSNFNLDISNLLKILISVGILIILNILLKYFLYTQKNILGFVISTISFFMVYFFLLFLFKENTIIGVLQSLKKILPTKKNDLLK